MGFPEIVEIVSILSRRFVPGDVMDLSLYNIEITIHLVIEKRRRLLIERLPELIEILKMNGIRNIILKSDQNFEYIRQIVSLLEEIFHIWIECSPDNYQLLKKNLLPSIRCHVKLMPIIQLENGFSGFRGLLEQCDQEQGLVVGIKTNKKLFPERIKIVKEMIRIAGDKPIAFYWDCGFLFCDFKDPELLGYFIEKGSIMKFYCLSPMQIDADLKMKYCDSIRQRRVDIFKNKWIMERFYKVIKDVAPYQNFGLLNQCNSCTYFPKICCGGCKAIVKGNFT
jgi:hypothetical protein